MWDAGVGGEPAEGGLSSQRASCRACSPTEGGRVSLGSWKSQPSRGTSNQGKTAETSTVK